MRKHILNIKIEHKWDADADTSYLDQEGFEDRRDAYHRDAFGYIGIMARAEVSDGHTVQRLTSGGLWGIESDSDNEYLKSIEAEELSALCDVLANFGFGKRAIRSACAAVSE